MLVNSNDRDDTRNKTKSRIQMTFKLKPIKVFPDKLHDHKCFPDFAYSLQRLHALHKCDSTCCFFITF